MKIVINPQHFRALCAVAPKNDVRYYLNGLFLDFENERVIATDGHRLLTVPFDIDLEDAFEETPTANLIIERPSRPPKRGIFHVHIKIISLLEPPNVIYEYGDRRLKFEKTIANAIDGRYPDCQRVIDSCESKPNTGMEVIAFNPSYLEDVTRHLNSQPVLHFKGEGEAIKVEYTRQSRCHYYLMPVKP